MGSKKEKAKQNPPPPPPKQEEESSSEELEEEEPSEDEVEEEKEVEEEESHQQKPQPSSSSDGTQSDSDETDDDDDDQSTTHHPKRQATPPPPETVPNSGSEDDDDDETESVDEGEEDPASESPRSATASAFTVKPIATVPVNSKNSKPTPTPKRALESSKNDKGLTKKAKTGEGENDKKGKGGAFPGRVWSEESEIVVLQGLVNYQREKGQFRLADTGVFYEFIKGKLWDGVTKTQIGDKIKRLKTKYGKNVKNGKNGQDPIFLKAHDRKAFELSKQIWGAGSSRVSNGKEDKAKTKTKAVDIEKGGKKVSNAGSETKKVVENSSKVKSDDPKGKKGSTNDGSALMDVDVDVNGDANRGLVKNDELEKGDAEGDFLSKFPTLSKSFDAETVSLKDYLHLIGSQSAGELEEEWKQLQLEEMNVAAKRVILKGKQTKLVLDAMKKQ